MVEKIWEKTEEKDWDFSIVGWKPVIKMASLERMFLIFSIKGSSIKL